MGLLPPVLVQRARTHAIDFTLRSSGPGPSICSTLFRPLGRKGPNQPDLKWTGRRLATSICVSGAGLVTASKTNCSPPHAYPTVDAGRCGLAQRVVAEHVRPSRRPLTRPVDNRTVNPGGDFLTLALSTSWGMVPRFSLISRFPEGRNPDGRFSSRGDRRLAWPAASGSSCQRPRYIHICTHTNIHPLAFGCKCKTWPRGPRMVSYGFRAHRENRDRRACAGCRALGADSCKSGVKFELDVDFHAGRKHLPIVTLKRAA